MYLHSLKLPNSGVFQKKGNKVPSTLNNPDDMLTGSTDFYTQNLGLLHKI